MVLNALALLAIWSLLCPATGQLPSKVLSTGQTPAPLKVLELPSIMSSALTNSALEALSGDAKTDEMIKLLKKLTAEAQAPFIEVLKKFGIESTPFWISNKIAMINLTQQAMAALKALPGNFKIRNPFRVKLSETFPSERANAADSTVEWNVHRIGATKVWATGNKGKGVVVANIDTGVLGSHPDLKDNYAGHFHDNTTSKKSPQPYDDHGHGTHVMGTICGKNGIGVAPGAKWVACKGLRKRRGNDVWLSECAQWILELKERPTVVANSWGGGQNRNVFDDEIAAWRAAGIVPIFSIGNKGKNCGTADSPGDRKGAIAVGATTKESGMATFSSRGPAKGTNLIKPDLSAPGDKIRSAWNNGKYNTISGTSMACPLVAGGVALMRAKDPKMTIETIQKKLQDTANKSSKVTKEDLACGGKTGNEYPNNAFGHGIINLAKALGVK